MTTGINGSRDELTHERENLDHRHELLVLRGGDMHWDYIRDGFFYLGGVDSEVVLKGRMKIIFLNIYLRWLESRIDLKVYDDVLSRKIDRVKELLGE